MRRERGRASYSPIPCKRLEIRQDDTPSLRSHPSPSPEIPMEEVFPAQWGIKFILLPQLSTLTNKPLALGFPEVG